MNSDIKDISELKKEKVFIVSEIKGIAGAFWFLLFLPVAILRFALIFRFGISIVWRMPVSLYELWAFIVIGFCYWIALNQSVWVALGISALVSISVLIQIASNFEPDGESLKIQKIPEHKLSIYGLLIEAFIVVLGFSCIYFCLSFLDQNAFSERLGVLDSIFYSFMVGTTVGFGDIHPVSAITKILTIIEAFFGLIFVVFMVAVFISVWINKKGSSEKDT